MSGNIDQVITIATLMTLMHTKVQGLSEEERIQRAKDIEERKERSRVEWFISQGKCPICSTKLKRGKKDKNYIRKWWCIKCNMYFSKE